MHAFVTVGAPGVLAGGFQKNLAWSGAWPRRHQGRAAHAGAPLFSWRMGHQPRDRKQVIVERLREQLQNAEAVVALPLTGLKHRQIEQFKGSLPATVRCKVVKNSFFQKAANGVTWLQGASEGDKGTLLAQPLLKMANFWLFAEKLDDLPSAIRAYQELVESLKLEETNKIRGGVLEGHYYDGNAVVRIGKIPSKKKLYQDMAIVMRMVPTRLARTLKAVPTNLTRAVKLAKVPDEEA